MSRRAYLVLLLLVLAAVATGVYFRQRALRQASCETPAAPPPQTTPPPKLPGFAIEAACGTGTEPPTRLGSGQAKAAEKKK